MTLVDLINQVQKILPVRFGGTGNPKGWANDSVIGAYVNGTGSTIARYTVVELARYTVIGGGIITDSRIKPTTEASTQNIVGVVVGRYRLTDPVGQYEDADVPDGELAAVCIMGRCLVQVDTSVLVGEYAYTSSTDGKATSSTYLLQGGWGTFESAGSTSQWVRIWGAPTTPGVGGGIVINMGDGITNLVAGTSVDFVVPFNMRLLFWTLLAKSTGSISVDLYRDSYANYPPNNADSITSSYTPYITSGLKNQDEVPFFIDSFGSEQGWQRDLDEGETIRVVVESAGGITQVSLNLQYIRR